MSFPKLYQQERDLEKINSYILIPVVCTFIWKCAQESPRKLFQIKAPESQLREIGLSGSRVVFPLGRCGGVAGQRVFVLARE